MSPLIHCTMILVIYTIFLIAETANYVELFYDNLNTNNGWNSFNAVDFNNHFNCPGFPLNCVALSVLNGDSSYIWKSFNVSGYETIRITFDLTVYGMEDNGDQCKVRYIYGTDGSGANSYNDAALTGTDGTYLDQSYDIA
eukprot:532768_1